MRPFTPRKRTSTRPRPPRGTKTGAAPDPAGPDDAHRREIETMLEDSSR